MKEKFGYDSYCGFFGNHKGNPCPCGWSTSKEAREFREQLTYYQDLYKKETGKKILSINDLHYWLIERILSKEK